MKFFFIKSLIVLLIPLLGLTGCDDKKTTEVVPIITDPGKEAVDPNVVPNTTASPPGGTYDSAQTVTLKTDVTASTYYSLDGTTPTENSSGYSSDTSIIISEDTVLKFFSIVTDGIAEIIKTQKYIISDGVDITAPTTLPYPTGGKFTAVQKVVLLSDEPSGIYYTTDGSDPTADSPDFTKSIVIGENTILKFFAKDSTGNAEAIKTEEYIFGTSDLRLNGTLQGRLLDAATLQPIAGATIDLATGITKTTGRGLFYIPKPSGYNSTGGGSAINKAVIDLRNVTSPVNMTDSSTTPRYPNFVFENADIIWDNLESNVDYKIGKLSATIKGVVSGCVGTPFSPLKPVGADYIVKLRTLGDSNNSGTGANGNVVSTVNTDDSGTFTFANIEANKNFTIDATSPDGTATTGNISVTSPVDGETLSLTIQNGDLLSACSNDSKNPQVIAVSPDVGSDLSPGTVTVDITFSEPILQNSYTSVGLGSVGNLYDDFEVKYAGLKSTPKTPANIDFSLAWNSIFDQLTVTLTTATSGLYYVRLPNIGNLTDARGLPAQIGVCPDDDNVPADYSTPSDGAADDCTVYFSTNGGVELATAPTIVVTNDASLDQGGTQDAQIDWLWLNGAKHYNLYCEEIQVWQDGTTIKNHSIELAQGQIINSEISYTVPNTFVEYLSIALKYKCYVKGVNSDNLESPTSNVVTLEDKVGPIINAGNPIQCGNPNVACDSNGNIISFDITFSEPLREGEAEMASNYTFVDNSGINITVNSAALSRTGVTVTLNIEATDPLTLQGYINNGSNGVTNSTIDFNDTLLAIDDARQNANCVMDGTNGNGVNDSITDDGSGGSDDTLNPNIGVGTYIYRAGGNGVCHSTAGGDDIQLILWGNGLPNQMAITAGSDGILQTTVTGDDTLVSPGKVTVIGIKDIAGNDIGNSFYNADGTVE